MVELGLGVLPEMVGSGDRVLGEAGGGDSRQGVRAQSQQQLMEEAQAGRWNVVPKEQQQKRDPATDN